MSHAFFVRIVRLNANYFADWDSEYNDNIWKVCHMTEMGNL